MPLLSRNLGNSAREGPLKGGVGQLQTVMKKHETGQMSQEQEVLRIVRLFDLSNCDAL